MPTIEQHFNFVSYRPYAAWYLAVVEGIMVGATYLTHQREIGVGILKSRCGNGYAKSAITELMRLHPGRFLANINPANEASIALFKSLGFGGPIQITLERQA
jgi:RimJ/RimL family protein N-acetyltransferase